MNHIDGRSTATAILAISVIAAAAYALAPKTVIASEAQQIIPDIIISSTIPPKGDLHKRLTPGLEARARDRITRP